MAERFPGALIVRLPALFGPGLKKNFLFDMLNPLPAMLPPAGLAQLEQAVGSARAPVLRALYPLDEALGMHVVDRARLHANADRAALEAAVTEAGLSALRFTHPDSRFQFYDMGHLWRDIVRGLENGLSVLHSAPPPVSAGKLHLALTGEAMPDAGARLHREDMRTCHAGLWGEHGPYIATPAQVLAGVQAFVAAEREAA